MIIEHDRAFMTARELRSLLEYSTSLPSGTTAGKRWRRAVWPWRNKPNDEWRLGEYGVPFPEGHKYHGEIPIIWRQIIVTDVPRKWPAGVAVLCRRLR